ncbi:MAG: hypothetical protein KDD69_02205 [Bdellovibrionales bacterium]|nr:hypothetical protein [Bdellovibrionales bacterium]
MIASDLESAPDLVDRVDDLIRELQYLAGEENLFNGEDLFSGRSVDEVLGCCLLMGEAKRLRALFESSELQELFPQDLNDDGGTELQRFGRKVWEAIRSAKAEAPVGQRYLVEAAFYSLRGKAIRLIESGREIRS